MFAIRRPHILYAAIFLSFLAFSAAVSTTLHLPDTEKTTNLPTTTIRLLQENSSSLTLAAKRTRRRDPLNNFKLYTNGFNITSKHYWASVALTAAPFFAIGAIWFLVFGLTLTFICLCYCCCPKEPYGYSRLCYALSLVVLILFTIAAIVGCVVLYAGQGKFHSATTNTLEYVVDQANTTAANLRNISEYLSAAKSVNVSSAFLPASTQSDIDKIDIKLNSSANTVSKVTHKNSKRIQDALDITRWILIILAAVMLVLTFLGFVFSVFGIQFLVYLLVIIGWVLVACTFILCGVFLVFHNATSDTCVAMDEWVKNPTAKTAMDDIIPCVDNETSQQTLTQTKAVTYQIVSVLDGILQNVSNANVPPQFKSLYYNQSGPLVPPLCNPFNPDYTSRTCGPNEVDISNATKVLMGYTCEVSSSGICTSRGRVTPTMYSQMASAVNISYALYRYGPYLVELENCAFVRDTLRVIERDYCPKLKRYTEWIYVGVVIVGGCVMLSLIFWVIYARERRHRVYTKRHGQP